MAERTGCPVFFNLWSYVTYLFPSVVICTVSGSFADYTPVVLIVWWLQKNMDQEYRKPSIHAERIKEKIPGQGKPREKLYQRNARKYIISEKHGEIAKKGQ
jgi:hypothetical protein